MHESSYQEMMKFAGTLDTRKELIIGDVGSMDVNGCYRGLFTTEKWTYRGYDLEAGLNVDEVLCDEYSWSNVGTNYHDVVISGQVLEHICKPWYWIKEVARITKVGGTICIIAPHTWEYHMYPIDCWRVWPDGMHGLFEEGNIEPVNIYANESDTVAIGRKK
jgi:hypothetical protein